MAKVKKDRVISNTKFYVAIAVLFVIVIAFVYLYLQTTSLYNSVKSNYVALQTNYNTQENQLNNANSNLVTNKSNYAVLLNKYNATLVTTKSNYAVLLNKYNATEYNLTHPYTKTLFDQKTINLPRLASSNYSYNSTSNIYFYSESWGRFNYSFYAPYSGYLVFNGTSTIINIPSPSTCIWQVFVSNKVGWRNVSSTFVGNNSGFIYNYRYRYSGNDGLFINLTSTPWVELCPLQSVTYYIPVYKGENYLFIDNYNSSQGITVTFSAKYVGLHTS
jgi:hypothetical protein